MLPFIMEKDYIDQTDDDDEDEWLDRQTDIQIERHRKKGRKGGKMKMSVFLWELIRTLSLSVIFIYVFKATS